jgi:hypothetical protein
MVLVLPRLVHYSVFGLFAGISLVLHGCEIEIENSNPDPVDRGNGNGNSTGKPPSSTPKTRSDAYFLLIGDWGATDWTRNQGGAGNAQRRVADRMKDYVKKETKNLLFVGALGDNFYGGVGGGDGTWRESWTGFYGELTDVPWYATLGNHDFSHADIKLGCPSSGTKGNQLDNGQSIRTNYNMPDHNYYKEFPDVRVEIISVDQNYNGAGHFAGGSVCWDHIDRKRQEGEKLLRERAKVSRDDTTYLIIQHYPSRNDHVKGIWRGSGGKGTLISAFGHDHNCWESGESILSGGGGGYGGSYCFVAVHLNDHGGSVRKEVIKVW